MVDLRNNTSNLEKVSSLPADVPVHPLRCSLRRFVHRLSGALKGMRVTHPSLDGLADKPCPLSSVRTRDALRVVNVQTSDGGFKRLADLGLVSDAKIRVASTCGSSFIVVLSESSRLALGPEMADAIWVERAS